MNPLLYTLAYGAGFVAQGVPADHGVRLEPLGLGRAHEVGGQRVQHGGAGLPHDDRREPGVAVLDGRNGAAHAVRRHPGRRNLAHRANLLGNTALARMGRRPSFDVGPRAVNATCRPYHLGWILEAWRGREHLYEAASEVHS